MLLTTKNAEQYIGKTLDCTKRFFHHYPLFVFKCNDGTYGYRDRCGTCMLVPNEKDTFNNVRFDTVNGELMEDIK